jgi:hypothetical protein
LVCFLWCKRYLYAHQRSIIYLIRVNYYPTILSCKFKIIFMFVSYFYLPDEFSPSNILLRKQVNRYKLNVKFVYIQISIAGLTVNPTMRSLLIKISFLLQISIIVQIKKELFCQHRAFIEV